MIRDLASAGDGVETARTFTTRTVGATLRSNWSTQSESIRSTTRVAQERTGGVPWLPLRPREARTLDSHASGLDGRCVACGTSGPCPHREHAVVTYSRYLRLPRRRPGATRPELAGISTGSWFRR